MKSTTRLIQKIGLYLTIFFASSAAIGADYTIGFDQTTLYHNSERPLKTSIWYPSATTFPREKIAENQAFKGTSAVRIGKPLTGNYPLVLISHGYRGNWRNQNWLATRLAAKGYIVAAIDHPGTTSFDHTPKLAAQWWQRPQDISRLIDWLTQASYLKDSIKQNDITAIGHSLGGWTVMALAGAEFDRQQLLQICKNNFDSRVCSVTSELGMKKQQAGEATSSLKDHRIKRVVSLDLGLAHSFSKTSLNKLTTPVLILAAGIDIGDLPQAEESGFIAKHAPKSVKAYKVYEDATHFSFMQRCKPGAVALIESETPGDGIVCKDGNKRSRSALHDEFFKEIIQFINTH